VHDIWYFRQRNLLVRVWQILLFTGVYTDVAQFSTCEYQGPGFTDELEDFGSGVYLRDTITLQGVTTKHVDFGYVTSYGNPGGIVDPAATIAGKFHDDVVIVLCDPRV